MDSIPPAHGPARHLDDLVEGARRRAAAEDDGPPPDLPEVVEAVTGRARDLHELADRLSADHGEPGRAAARSRPSRSCGPTPARSTTWPSTCSAPGRRGLATTRADDTGPEGPGPRGVPRSAG